MQCYEFSYNSHILKLWDNYQVNFLEWVFGGEVIVRNESMHTTQTMKNNAARNAECTTVEVTINKHSPFHLTWMDPEYVPLLPSRGYSSYNKGFTFALIMLVWGCIWGFTTMGVLLNDYSCPENDHFRYQLWLVDSLFLLLIPLSIVLLVVSFLKRHDERYSFFSL